MRRSWGIPLGVAVLVSACAHPMPGVATAPDKPQRLYPVVRPLQGDLEDHLLNLSDVRAVTDLPELTALPALEAVLSNDSTVSDCAYGHSLAVRQQYLGFSAARIQSFTQVSGNRRQYTVGNALLVFETPSWAAQQFRQFSSRMSRCDGAHGVTMLNRDAENWTLQVIRSDDDEVNWTRSTDGSPWSCRLMASQRANYVASVMFCRLGSDNDKAEALLVRLLDKLTR
jgi:hypothetical protein